MNILSNTLEKPKIQAKQLDTTLLQGILEGFIDGILILTDQGEVVHANDRARQICHQLKQNSSQPHWLPKEIWRVCLALTDSRELYPHQPIILESEITTGDATSFRVRVRWLELEALENSCILVTIENPRQSVRRLAIAEVEKYGLTSREAEVWLLRRANYTYKEIAAELFISLNTVKKHVKNILAKREMALGWDVVN